MNNAMPIPDRETCLKMMKESGMLSNIYRHSQKVASIALLLARELTKTGSFFDMALVEAGALLHDITKTRSLKTGERHAQSGEAELVDLGFPEVARVVGQHVRLDPASSPHNSISEVELVYYADKRVMHETVVSLEERYKDIENRYARTEQHRVLLKAGLDAAIEVERKLFSGLDFTPDQLEEKLGEAA